MIYYIFLLSIIYIIYNYNKPILDLSTNNSKSNKFINYLLQRNTIILLSSITGIFIINKIEKELNIPLIFIIIGINIYLWIEYIRYQNYNKTANDINEEFKLMENDKHYELSKENKKHLNSTESVSYANKLNEYYADNVIIHPELEKQFNRFSNKEIEKEQHEIECNTVNLALNSDKMFYMSDEEANCLFINQDCVN